MIDSDSNAGIVEYPAADGSKLRSWNSAIEFK